MRIQFFLLLLAGVLATSCVQNRKLTYLQKDDINPKLGALPNDTVLRTYDIPRYEYRIQSNDVLQIRFNSITPEEYDFFTSEESQLRGGIGGGGGGIISLFGELVDEEGYVIYPVVGKVKVAGLTIYEAQDKLMEIAKEYLEEPTVSVRITNFRFSIHGEVRASGTFTTFNPRVSLMEALGLAGGVDELADRSNIKIIRQIGDQSFVYYVNLLDESFLNSPFYYIHQNDIIVVPALRQRPFRKYFGPNFALISGAVSFLLLLDRLSE